MRYTSKNLYAVEEADTHPDLIDYLKQQINKNLSSAIFVEAEKGDVIVHFGEFKIDPQTEINCQSLRRAIDINPLIRCKDCKWWEDDSYTLFQVIMRDDNHHHCISFDAYTKADDYCSFAGRREDAEEEEKK